MIANTSGIRTTYLFGPRCKISRGIARLASVVLDYYRKKSSSECKTMTMSRHARDEGAASLSSSCHLFNRFSPIVPQSCSSLRKAGGLAIEVTLVEYRTLSLLVSDARMLSIRVALSSTAPSSLVRFWKTVVAIREY